MRKLLKSFKTEINPTIEQKIKINKTIGTCRYVYNFYLSHNKTLYDNGEKFMSGKSFSVWLNNEYLPKNPDKLVILYGNAVKIAGDKILLVPRDGTGVINDLQQSEAIDIGSPGLNLSKYRYDINFDPQHHDQRYRQNLNFLSKSETIRLLSPKVACSDDLSVVKFGTLYELSNGEIKEIFKERQTRENKIEKRKIPPIRAIYTSDQDTDAIPTKTGEESTKRESE